MRKSKLILELEKEKRKNKGLEKEVFELKRLLESELKAKENGCHRGNYCSVCENAVLIDCGGKVTCYCTYGQCEHFKKETHFLST